MKDFDPTQTKPTLELDLSTEEFTKKLAEAPVFAKKSLVNARVATAGEKITTTLADGTQETVNSANEGDVIITNPGGEEYIIGDEKFTKRYEPTQEEGVYRAKGMARAFQNDTGRPIEIMAPWGEKQFGDTNCMVATTFDPDSPNEVSADRYIIGRQEFEDTYGPIEEVLADEV
jgi:hypothetical protein